MQTEHSPFPPDETLAAYIDGRLDEETRKRVVEHMAECPECFYVLNAHIDWSRSQVQSRGSGEVRQFHPMRVAVLSALATAAVITIVILRSPLREHLFPATKSPISQ